MQKISYARYGFQPELILRVVSLYFRFPLGYRDVEDLLAERGFDWCGAGHRNSGRPMPGG